MLTLSSCSHIVKCKKMSKRQSQGAKIHKDATVWMILVVSSTHMDWVQMSENGSGVHKWWMSSMNTFDLIIYLIVYYTSNEAALCLSIIIYLGDYLNHLFWMIWTLGINRCIFRLRNTISIGSGGGGTNATSSSSSTSPDSWVCDHFFYFYRISIYVM